jgi:hypothetical protein
MVTLASQHTGQIKAMVMCLGTPGISAVKRALLSGMINPEAGHAEVLSRLFVAHRYAAKTGFRVWLYSVWLHAICGRNRCEWLVAAATEQKQMKPEHQAQASCALACVTLAACRFVSRRFGKL